MDWKQRAKEISQTISKYMVGAEDIIVNQEQAMLAKEQEAKKELLDVLKDLVEFINTKIANKAIVGRASEGFALGLIIDKAKQLIQKYLEVK